MSFRFVGRHLFWGVLGCAFSCCVFFLLFNLVWPLEKNLFFPSTGIQILDVSGKPLRFFLSKDDTWRFETPLDKISPVLRQVTLASEDRWFYSHFGVNPFSVVRAAWSNLRAGRVISGASTISMQLARLINPAPRTFRVKLRESLRALQIEFSLTKKEILERYLNLAPFGRNIVGVGAAAWFYFGKTAERLSLGEAALLVALPRAPAAYDPMRHPERARTVRNRILARVGEYGLFSPEEIQRAMREPLPRAFTPLPMYAPHFCELAARFFHGGQARTSLELDLQLAVRARFRLHLQKMREQGIRDGACVVLDRFTHNIQALIGSYDFFDAERGQINAALVSRSPGSTLKPFLFAQAFDSGKILPQSVVFDIPMDFSGYSPNNYDGKFRGMISAGSALASSRNVPAVRLLSDIGLDHFHALLRKGGLQSLDEKPDQYGLSFVLGACEVNLLELTNLYGVLANSGDYRPWGLAAEAEPARPVSLLSPAAVWLTNQILTLVERPDLGQAWALTRDIPRVAWKTGTSFGHRDAWAIGFSGRHIIGVWVGNLTGEAVQGISGAQNAGPLLFDLFRAVQTKEESLVLPRPDDAVRIPVCVLSGLRATSFCPHKELVWAVGEHLPEPCNWHKRIFVDSQSGERLVGACLGLRPHKSRILTVYPREIAGWRREQGMANPQIPPVSKLCTQVAPGKGPLVVSPSPATPYILQKGVPVEWQKIPLVARSEAGVKTLYWFFDGKLVAQGPPEKKHFLALEKGHHHIVVQDDLGRSTSLHIQVE